MCYDALYYQDLRAALADTAARLEREGLLAGTAGNLSCRLSRDRIAITPSGMRYPGLKPADIVVTDLDGRVVDSSRSPSSELPFHTAIYRARPDVGAVVHTHSPYATVLAILRKPIPAVHYAIAALRVNEIPIVAYANYDSEELASKIERVVETGANGVLLANHGAIAIGPDLHGAAENAVVLEFLACAYHRTLAVGTPFVLSREEIERVIESDRRYVQWEPRKREASAP